MAQPDAVVVVHDPFIAEGAWLNAVKRKIWYIHGAFAFTLDVTKFPQPLFAISNYPPAKPHPSWRNIFIAPVNLGIDCDKYKPMGVTKTGKLIIGIVRRISEEKIPLYFFDFIDKFNAEHPDHNFEFHFYGRGLADSAFYKAFFERARTTLNFYYKGFVEPAEAASIYATFDCLIVPSTSESGSFVIVEAQSCGLRVYALNRDGIPYHMAANSVLCRDYDEMFKRLEYFKRKDAAMVAPLIRAQIVAKYGLVQWAYKLDLLAEMASFI